MRNLNTGKQIFLDVVLIEVCLEKNMFYHVCDME